MAASEQAIHLESCTELLTPPKAPVNFDGSFLVTGLPEVTIPRTANGDPMSPIETSTGIVLPIVSTNQSMHPQFHHGNFYKTLYEQGGLGTRAVRYSRLQKVWKGPHQVYHDNYDGTRLPTTPGDEYSLVVLNCASYIPAYCVLIHNHKVEIAPISRDQRSALLAPGEFRIEKQRFYRAAIGQFLMYHAIAQEFDPQKLLQIEQFLAITPEAMARSSEQRALKLRLGMQLTNTAIATAVNSVDGRYRQARRQRVIREGAPACAWQLVKGYVKGHEPEYFSTLQHRLETGKVKVAA